MSIVHHNHGEIGLLVRIEAKPEYTDQVEAALRGAQELAEQEQDTVTWFAFRQDATTFGVFETFDDEQGRQGTARRCGARGAPTGRRRTCWPR